MSTWALVGIVLGALAALVLLVYLIAAIVFVWALARTARESDDLFDSTPMSSDCAGGVHGSCSGCSCSCHLIAEAGA